MNITRSDVVAIRTESDIVLARQAVRKLTLELAFSVVDQTKMVTAASELARNALVYGLGGRMEWALITDGRRNGLQLRFIDEGPGIPDLAQAMTDGWTSGGGMGLGLSGARRLVQEFDIQTASGQGTRVTVTRWK